MVGHQHHSLPMMGPSLLPAAYLQPGLTGKYAPDQIPTKNTGGGRNSGREFFLSVSPLIKEAWSKMQGWYKASANFHLPFARITIAQMRSDQVVL